MSEKRKWHHYNTKMPEPKFNTDNPRHKEYMKEKSPKHKALIKYGDKRDYRKIDVYHNGKYAHSTTWSKNLKEAKSNSKLEGGKIKAEYSKNN